MNHFIGIPQETGSELAHRVNCVIHNIRGNDTSRYVAIQYEFSKMVSHLFKEMENETSSLLHAAVGISGEAGELLDAVKKTWIYNKPLDVQNVIEELGDLFFYAEKILLMLGLTAEQVKLWNMYKLQHAPNARFKYGYTDKAAQIRADKTDPPFRHAILGDQFEIELTPSPAEAEITAVIVGPKVAYAGESTIPDSAKQFLDDRFSEDK